MIKHIVMWQLKEFADGRAKHENIELLNQKFAQLPQKIEAIKTLKTGVNIEGCPFSNFDYVLETTFENFGALESYQTHPDHQEVGRFVREVVASRACVDYEF